MRWENLSLPVSSGEGKFYKEDMVWGCGPAH